MAGSDECEDAAPLVPSGSLLRIAALVDVAARRHPELLAQYLAALETGEALATLMLWRDLARDRCAVAATIGFRSGDAATNTSARLGLLLLVALDGWRRVKTCCRAGCTSGFVDPTNGGTRRNCAAHLRHPR